MNKVKIFSGRVGETLATKICDLLGLSLGQMSVKNFADGELNVELHESVRGKDVFIINPTNPPFENMLELTLLADAAKRASAKTVTIVPVYLGYNRQDRKDRPRVPFSSKVIIDFLSSVNVDRAVLLDLHAEPTAGFFDNRIVVDHLHASYVAIPYLKERFGKDIVIASPDKGGGPRAEGYAKRLGLQDYVFFSKSRPRPSEVGDIKIIGEVKDKDILLVDDMIDSGGTMIKDAEAAMKAGAKSVSVFAVHGIFSGEAIDKFVKSPIKEVIITDTISHEKLPDKFTVVSVAPLVAEAIKRIVDDGSISDLFI